jgi:hypothetical protein
MPAGQGAHIRPRSTLLISYAILSVAAFYNKFIQKSGQVGCCLALCCTTFAIHFGNSIFIDIPATVLSKLFIQDGINSLSFVSFPRCGTFVSSAFCIVKTIQSLVNQQLCVQRRRGSVQKAGTYQGPWCKNLLGHPLLLRIPPFSELFL